MLQSDIQKNSSKLKLSKPPGYQPCLNKTLYIDIVFYVCFFIFPVFVSFLQDFKSNIEHKNIQAKRTIANLRPITPFSGPVDRRRQEESCSYAWSHVCHWPRTEGAMLKQREWERKQQPWNSRALLIDVHSSKYLHLVVVY